MSQFSCQALLLTSLLLGILVVISEGFAIPTKCSSASAVQAMRRTIAKPTTMRRRTAMTTTTPTFALLAPFDPSFCGGASSTMLSAANPAESKCLVSHSMAVFGAVWGL